MKNPQFRVYSYEELLQQDGRLVYTNTGNSMMPLLRQRKDLIEISAKGPERCRKYDIVLYKRGDMYIVHRVLKVLPRGYLVAGDHNTFLERDVTDSMILGTVTRILRDGRAVNMTGWRYRAYVHLWCDFYPLRMLLLKVKAAAARLRGRNGDA